MRTTRRTLLVLVVLALVLPLAAAAGAKPNKPAPVEPVYYQVELTLTGEHGLATTCPGPITMEFGDFGYKAGQNTDPAELVITADIVWSRLLPEPTGDKVFSDECHGSQINEPPPTWHGILQIKVDRAGNPTGLVWHFDYYFVQTGHGKNQRTEALEWLTLRSGDDFAATETAPGSGVYDVSGTFTLYRENPADSPHPVFQGSSYFKFTMAFTKVS